MRSSKVSTVLTSLHTKPRVIEKFCEEIEEYYQGYPVRQLRAGTNEYHFLKKGTIIVVNYPCYRFLLREHHITNRPINRPSIKPMDAFFINFPMISPSTIASTNAMFPLPLDI